MGSQSEEGCRMPLVRIDVLEGRTDEELRRIGDSVHQALVEQLNVPERDLFHVITRHTTATLQFDRHYLDIERSNQFVMVQVTLAAGRTDEAKSGFYRRLAELLADRIGLRTEDLAVALVENERVDWSFGRGEASYLVRPREEWR
jgi:phenylpyruvate tautomerase PptA (4-oxalocrotonate tautomerase family)